MSYPDTRGFMQDRAQLFKLLDRIATSLETMVKMVDDSGVLDRLIDDDPQGVGETGHWKGRGWRP